MRVKKRELALVVAAILLLLITAYLIAPRLPLDDDRVAFWLQVLTGNFSSEWSPFNGKHQTGSVEYLIGTVLALLLNLGSFTLIVGYAAKRILERSEVMKIENAFIVKEADIKQALYDVLQDDFDRLGPLVDKAFEKGADVWKRKHLPEIFGNAGARKFLEKIKEDFPEPS